LGILIPFFVEDGIHNDFFAVGTGRGLHNEILIVLAEHGIGPGLQVVRDWWQLNLGRRFGRAKVQINNK
jgi:hypothetical protein